MWNKPTYKKRKEYALYTGILFCSDSVLYGYLTYQLNLFFPDHPISVLQGMIMGGCFLGGLCSGVILFSRLLSQMPTAVKILCAVFFMFTILFIEIIGVFPLIPYYVYNMVMLIKEKRNQQIVQEIM